jgi:predicted nucleic acid-binding protein
VLVLDANLWIAAFDPADRFHRESVEVFRAAAKRGEALAGPAYLPLEAVCALARRLGDGRKARAAAARLADHPALHLEPLTESLLAEAAALGVERRLRAADALYAATAERLGCPLLSWDTELVDRAGAAPPRQWLAEVVEEEG